MPTYYNYNTKQKIYVDEASSRLESLPQWTVVDDDEDTAARDRARAEKESIEDSAKGRTDQAQRYHEEAQQVAADSAKSRQGGNVNVTLASSLPEGYQATEGVLARAKRDQAEGRLQIGPDPERHPRTKEELEAKAEADSAAIAAMKPEDSSVLERAGEGLADTDDAARRAAEQDRESRDQVDSDSDSDTADDDSVSESDLEQPSRSGKTESWRRYAVARGATEDEVADLNRDELITRYGQ